MTAQQAEAGTPKDRPVVLVHGLGGSTATTWQSNGWLDLIADAGRPAMGIDLLGHGTADKPTDPNAYTALHEHVLDHLPEGPVDAIGFSLGAITLLHAAAQAPERFSRLVLSGVGSNLFETKTEERDKIRAAVGGVGDPTDPFVRYFADLANDPTSDAEALRALRRLRCDHHARIGASWRQRLRGPCGSTGRSPPERNV